MNLAIRRATEADAALLSEMALKIFLDTFGEQNRREDIEMHAARSYSPEIQLAELRDTSKVYLVAEQDSGTRGRSRIRLAKISRRTG